MNRGIAFVGSIIHDRIYTVAEYPKIGSLARIECIKYAVGGLVPNDSIDIKKLRKSVPVYAFGKIGADEGGRYCLEIMKDVGVDISGVKISEKEGTGFTDVMSIEGGQRTFFSYAGANDTFGFDDIDFDSLDADMLHLGYFLLLGKVDSGDGLAILREAKRRGIKTSIDFVSCTPDKYPPFRGCLKYVDNLILNEQEAAALVGMDSDRSSLLDIASALLNEGVGERVIIHSPMLGVIANRNGTVTSLPSLDLPDGFIVGTAGAGDAFCSGALLGIYEGRTDREILEYATYSAAASLRSADGTGAMDDLENIKSDLSGLSFRAG